MNPLEREERGKYWPPTRPSLQIVPPPEPDPVPPKRRPLLRFASMVFIAIVGGAVGSVVTLAWLSGPAGKEVRSPVVEGAASETSLDQVAASEKAAIEARKDREATSRRTVSSASPWREPGGGVSTSGEPAPARAGGFLEDLGVRPASTDAATPSEGSSTAAIGVFGGVVEVAPPAPSARELAARVRRYYRDVSTFSADFTQNYWSGESVSADISSGTVLAKRPRSMRWSYNMPFTREVVLNGEHLQVYNSDDHTVWETEKSEGDALSEALMFLWDQGDWSQRYRLGVGSGTRSGASLELFPMRRHSDVWSIKLTVDVTGAVDMVVVRRGRNINRIEFNNIRLNREIEDERFSLHVPEGTTVKEL